jgi:hypothetical protein
VTSIEACAFWNCSALKNVKIPKGVTSIGEQAFSGCGMLASVWISENVTYIGDWAFEYDGNLKDVVFLGGPPVIETSSFCDVNANAYYPDDGSWAKANRKNYGGTLNWIPFTGEVVLNPFSDVKSGKYYYDAVLWAISQDPPITSGTSDTTFSPNQTCTRGQIVTFLWSAFGQPEPSDTDNPFEDVKAGKFYYKAVLWAVEKGITSGKDASHFAPNEPCSRCQVVTFLWNAYGKPEPSNTHNPFKDVTEGKYYYQAVLWAYYAGITSGIDTTHFGPDNTCTRGQVVTFLYSTRNIPKPE